MERAPKKESPEEELRRLLRVNEVSLSEDEDTTEVRFGILGKANARELVSVPNYNIPTFCRMLECYR